MYNGAASSDHELGIQLVKRSPHHVYTTTALPESPFGDQAQNPPGFPVQFRTVYHAVRNP